MSLADFINPTPRMWLAIVLFVATVVVVCWGVWR